METEQGKNTGHSTESNTEKNTEKKVPQTFMAEGFAFYTKEDADLASQEKKKAEYLHARMDFSKPESVLNIYEKAVNERIFKTPVGIGFLREVETFLLKSPQIDNDQVPPIFLHTSFDSEIREHGERVRVRVKPSEKKEKKSAALPISIILNIALAAAVIAMFVITLQADQPNILNYERVLTNRYAQWEQQLTEREQAIREKERELKMETE